MLFDIGLEMPCSLSPNQPEATRNARVPGVAVVVAEWFVLGAGFWESPGFQLKRTKLLPFATML